jgi:hypothetical protein
VARIGEGQARDGREILTHPWMKDGAQVIPNFILKRRFPPIS